MKEYVGRKLHVILANMGQEFEGWEVDTAGSEEVERIFILRCSEPSHDNIIISGGNAPPSVPQIFQAIQEHLPLHTEEE